MYSESMCTTLNLYYSYELYIHRACWLELLDLCITNPTLPTPAWSHISNLFPDSTTIYTPAFSSLSPTKTQGNGHNSDPSIKNIIAEFNRSWSVAGELMYHSFIAQSHIEKQQGELALNVSQK